MMLCFDRTPHEQHFVKETIPHPMDSFASGFWCKGRKSLGSDPLGDLIDEVDSRDHETEVYCDKFDRTHSEESETF